MEMTLQRACRCRIFPIYTLTSQININILSIQINININILTTQVVLDKIACPVVCDILEVLTMHLGKVAEADNRMGIENLGLLFGQVMVDDSKDRIFLFRFFFGPTPRLQWMQSSFQVN